MSQFICSILRKVCIDPCVMIQTDDGERTAFQILEAAINGALEQIEKDLV